MEEDGNQINGIYKVIMAVGETDPPVLVGMCEVENGFVLHKLVNDTPLGKFEYRVVHRESPDRRGIDVALLYRPDRFQVQEKEFVPVVFPDDSARKTREILYVRAFLLPIPCMFLSITGHRSTAVSWNRRAVGLPLL
jgi:hypothetical protein